MNAQVLRCYSRILCEGAGLKWNRWEYIIPAHGVSTRGPLVDAGVVARV